MRDSLGMHRPDEADASRLAGKTREKFTQPDSGFTRPQGGHAMALAFECESPSAVDRTYAALTKAWHRSVHEPWDAFWGQRYATVLDPDDNPVDLFCPL